MTGVANLFLPSYFFFLHADTFTFNINELTKNVL